ncbi:hypothetical protein NEISICOT_03139 [Neisseria sicca ATCC 29256]|uniref:Uncharacterized protein n=2 Tax=Neisseria TaxID=482 RepID=A0AA36XKB7_9NEIS|nr:hypothetical protein NEISICOT_03139 [Neisseria sicca ATCC 29256]EGQ76411.1 hypothetical protein HMPREF9418_1940 [Neisseria macacae ATCC 33926]
MQYPFCKEEGKKHCGAYVDYCYFLFNHSHIKSLGQAFLG